MPIIKQITNLVNDSVKDALGKNGRLTTLDTTDLVSMGKLLSEYDAFDKFYGALANRIIKTVIFVRSYDRKNRQILRDENEYGAFVQKVYAELPGAVDNPAQDVTQIDPSSGERSYKQASPYDVEGVVKISAIMFGGQGTWAKEFIYSKEEIKTAFTSEAAMMAVIDAIYLAADNALKLEFERIEADAVNTSMANCIKNGKARNLLAEYNTKHPTATLTLNEALEDLDFLKFATKEINRTIKNMGNMNVNFNVDGYETFTPKDKLVVEVLSEFATVTTSYLEADTYHKELVGLPGYNEISFWQNPGNSANFDFEKCSAINVKHNDIDPDNAINQTGIICFLHDTDNVAAYFGRRHTWEVLNPRSEVMIHGENARKGYAIDSHANSFVFYLQEVETKKAPTVEDTKEDTKEDKKRQEE